MAYTQNYYPGYTGEYPFMVDSEEERRRKEAEAQIPVKQTIEIDPATGAQKVKIEGSAYNLSDANPLTPTIKGPAVPEGVQVAGPADAAFQRMRQVESGNRDYDAQGRPITSPKGAMFASQVMPSTAANPGYGVAPAASQTPEEYNRVGREYYDAMLKKYNGDERLAQAAYNAGPGRVDQAVQLASAQGGDALQYLPRETQQYTQKVAAVSPEQLAQQQQTRAPAAQPVPGVQMAPAPAQQPPAPPPTFADQFNAASNDLGAMRNLLRSAPPQYQGAVTDRIIELAQREKAQAAVQQRAQEAIASGDMRGLTKEMNKNTQEGSLMKAFLLKTFGMEEAAQKESARALGTDVKYQTIMDPETGRSALIGVDRFTGMPVKGFDDTGVSLTPEQIARYGGIGKRNLDIVGGTYVSDTEKDAQGRPLVGRVVTDKGTGQSYIQTDKGMRPMAGFRPQSSQGSLGDMRNRLVQELNLKLQGKTEEEKMAITRDYNSKLVASGYDPVQPAEIGLRAPQIGGGAVAPTQVAPPAGGGAVAPVAPPAAGAATTATAAGQVAAGGAPAPQFPQVGQQPAAPRGAGATAGGTGTGGRPTGPELEAQAAAQKKFATDTAEDKALIAKNQGEAENKADYLITKIDELVKHEGFGTSVGAKGPAYLFGLRDTAVAPQFGGGPARDWTARFEEIKGGAFNQAIESLRGLGSMSDMEAKSASDAITRMKTSTTEAEFLAASKDFKEIIQRRIDNNRKKLGQEPKYGTPPESTQKEETAKPRRMNAEDKRALDWADKNPNDPRAAEIRRRLGQ